MTKKEKNPFQKLRGVRLVYPVLIGLGVVGYFLWKEFDPNAFKIFRFETKVVFFLILAAIFMMMRDIGYIFRMRVLTDKKLTWKQAIRVIFLWEFTSAVMPSAVGGTTVAMIYVNKEGLNLGKSTAVVMATSFLDELYFIIMFPLLLLTIKIPALFSVSAIGGGMSIVNEFLLFAVIGYSLKFIYTAILSYGLFVNPRGLKWLIMNIFRIPFLRKFRYEAHITGSDIITSSKELRSKNFLFWLKAFGATFFSWSSRYLVANALILAFFTVSDQLLLFARQLVMSNMLLIAPTPGGSGVAELIFTKYLKDFIAGGEAEGILISFLWRLISYYPYLIIGSILFPWWLKKKFRKKNTHHHTT